MVIPQVIIRIIALDMSKKESSAPVPTSPGPLGTTGRAHVVIYVDVLYVHSSCKLCFHILTRNSALQVC